MPTLHDELGLDHGPRWANRFALAPLTNKQSHPDGTLSDDEHDWLLARAEGGFGLTMTCASYVAQAGKAWPGQLGVSDDAHLPGLTRLAADLRAAGTVSSVQLHHGGRRADASVSGVPLVAPWADPDRGVHALTTAEVEQAVDDFVAAAVRAERAGFDGVQVHGAHGYLVGQFLDERHNHRTDGWGSTTEGRSRFVLEILAGIRERTASDFQLGLRLTPEGSGVSLGESLRLAERVMVEGLVDHLDMSLWDAFKAPADPTYDGGAALVIDAFAALARGTARLGVAGKILTAADAAWCLDHGADFVTLGTAAILHHDLPRLAADPAWASTPQPVTRAHLRAERVGPAFVDYLATGWDDFVSG